jgi:peptidoglycan/xylan/chitin deacetylase (PgdA/CDA1 family)
VESVRIANHRIDSDRIANGDDQDNRVTAVWAAAGLADGHDTPPRAYVPRRSETRRSESRSERGRGDKRRGRHVMTQDSITVRAVPAIRDWALDTDGQPPVMGSHRAPGTLPIESWLLVGKRRQQMLLASLVAVGLIVVAIPIQQRQSGINAVTAANHAATATQGHSSKSNGKSSDGTAKHQAPAATQGEKAKPPAKAPANPGQQPPPASTPATAAGPAALAVPPGSGPSQSLRTTGSSAVALTFDDGPDPVQTPKILALLAEHDVKATFCLVGQQVQKHPEIVAQIVAAGHTLCNHTWSHSLTIGKDKPTAIRADLERTNAAIRAAVPGAQIPFFRAPGGNFTDRLVSVAYADDMTSLYWEVDPRDWDHPEGEDDTAHIDRVIAELHKNVKPGSIILSHDFSQPDTIAAYESLLPWLTANFTVGHPVPPPIEPSATAPAPASSEPPVSPEQPAP